MSFYPLMVGDWGLTALPQIPLAGFEGPLLGGRKRGERGRKGGGKVKRRKKTPPSLERNSCYGFIAKYLCVQVDQEAPLIWPFVDTYSSLLVDIFGPRNTNAISFTLPAYLI